MNLPRRIIITTAILGQLALDAYFVWRLKRGAEERPALRRFALLTGQTQEEGGAYHWILRIDTATGKCTYLGSEKAYDRKGEYVLTVSGWIELSDNVFETVKGVEHAFPK